MEFPSLPCLMIMACSGRNKKKIKTDREEIDRYVCEEEIDLLARHQVEVDDQRISVASTDRLSLLHCTMSTSRNWSDLNIDLLCLIFEKIADSNINNLSNCAGVCVSWRSVRDHLVNNFSPIILFTNQCYERGENWWLILMNPNQGHYHIFNTGTRETQEIMLPELYGKWFHSIWPGWLFINNCKPPHQVSLLNPLTRAQISLPLPWGDEEAYGNFIVVPSSNPSDSKCIFLARYECVNQIKGFCRAGDKKWSMTTINDSGKCIKILEAIYFNGYFYIRGNAPDYPYDSDPCIYRTQIDENNMTPTVERLLRLPKSPVPEPFVTEYYMVELMGKLLLIIKHNYFEARPKQGFYANLEVHKLELNGDDNRWVRVTSLGGKHAIYTSHLQSVSIYVGESNARIECQSSGTRFLKMVSSTLKLVILRNLVDSHHGLIQ